MESRALLYGGVLITQSILNDDQNAKDKSQPFSFFEFLKYTNSTATPDQFNTSYKEYLERWYVAKGLEPAAAINQVKQQYISLLKDISLNYTTQEEKRFLTSINFNDDIEVTTVIPFYSQKIKEICQFYTSKREEVKHEVQLVKMKGTFKSFDKYIYDLIIDFLFTDDSESSYRLTNTALSSIGDNLQIEVEELFDTYSEYFDLDPDISYDVYNTTDPTRIKYYTSNLNDIDVDLFTNFDKKLIDSILRDVPVFIRELGDQLAVNINTSLLDLECDPNNPINLLVEKCTEELDLKLQLQKKLVQKYIGVDYYYLSTAPTTTDYVSGVLFEADNPSGNLLNRKWPSTASVEERDLKSARRLGLFFKPDKLGILYYNTFDKVFDVDTDLLEPNKVYIFPDPTIYGNITRPELVTYEYPLLYTIDNSIKIKNNSSQYAEGAINSTPHDQQYFGYHSTIDIFNDNNLSGNNVNFNWIYNEGIITHWRPDIYGNQYALFKQKYGARRTIDALEEITIRCYIMDGHEFYDQSEGYGFDYSVDTGAAYNGSLRTGLTALTIDDGSFPYIGTPIYLYFREFIPYEDCDGGRVVRCTLKDGAQFTFLNGDQLPEAISSDLSSWGTGSYYYNILSEGGVYTVSPPTRAVTDVPSQSADFTLDVGKELSNGGVSYDGGLFTDSCTDSELYVETLPGTITYSNSAYTSTLYDAQTGIRAYRGITDVCNLTGNLFVRNIVTNTVHPASSELVNIFRKYNDSVRYELESNIIDFDLVYDTLFIKTENYFVIDKIEYDGEFNRPGTPNIYYDLSLNKDYNKMSNIFFKENETLILYCKTTIHPTNSATNNKIIYPEIYKFDLKNHKSIKLYPTNLTTVQELSTHFSFTDRYSLSSLPSNILRITAPRLFYNSRNDKFCLMYIGEDGNNTGHIMSIIFNYNCSDVEIEHANIYKPDLCQLTHNFYELTGSKFYTQTIEGTAPIHNQINGEIRFN